MLLLRSLPRDRSKKCIRLVFAMRDMLSHAITSSPFGIWRKNTLIAVASCDTTHKIHRFSREWELNLSLIAIRRAMARSSRYHVVIGRSLAQAIRWKMYYCCSLITIQHKCYIVARILELASSRCDSKIMSMSSLLAIWQKYTLANDGMKAEWSLKSEVTSQQLRVWWAFWPSFFEVYIFERAMEKVEGKELVVR